MKYKIILYLVMLLFGKLFTLEVYNLELGKEAFIMTPSLLLSSYSFYKHSKLGELSPEVLDLLSKYDINRFDRIAVKNYSQTSRVLSDYLVGLCLIAPFTLNFQDKVGLNTNILILESYIWSTSLAASGKVIFQRKRPYVYNENVNMEVRKAKDGQLSFFSAHTTYAFTGAILTAKIYDDHFSDKYDFFIYSGAVATASTVGYLRFLAGKHYPTDIIVGALVGSGVAILITEVHKNKNQKSAEFCLPIFRYSLTF